MEKHQRNITETLEKQWKQYRSIGETFQKHLRHEKLLRNIEKLQRNITETLRGETLEKTSETHPKNIRAILETNTGDTLETNT